MESLAQVAAALDADLPGMLDLERGREPLGRLGSRSDLQPFPAAGDARNQLNRVLKARPVDFGRLPRKKHAHQARFHASRLGDFGDNHCRAGSHAIFRPQTIDIAPEESFAGKKIGWNRAHSTNSESLDKKPFVLV